MSSLGLGITILISTLVEVGWLLATILEVSG
jgi:hypothetical protein